MKKFLIWLYLLTKRQIKKISFIILILSIPAMIYGIKTLFTSYEISVNVAVYNPIDSEWADKIMSSLKSSTGIVKYIRCDSKEALIDMVTSGDAECGYAFHEDMEERMQSKNIKDIIDVYSAPDSMVAKLTNEIMFSYIFKVHAYNLLEDDMVNSGLFNDVEIPNMRNELRNRYNEYLTGNDTFQFAYSNDGTNFNLSIDLSSYTRTPVYGMIAVIIFMSGLAGALQWYKDKKTGMFITASYRFKPFIALIDIIIPTFITAIVSYISLCYFKIPGSPYKNLTALILYSLLVSAFVYILRLIISSETAFCTMIPFFAMASLVCCPIFINLATFIPVMRIVQKFLLPSYFLMLI